jgi:cell division inhibitor SulA
MLFEAAPARPPFRCTKDMPGSPPAREAEPFSEVSLRGGADQCLFLLAPMLRELSQGNDGRWLTLVSWLSPVNRSTRQRLLQAARTGQAQSLNIRLG